MHIEQRTPCYTWSRTQAKLYRRKTSRLALLGVAMGAVCIVSSLALFLVTDNAAQSIMGFGVGLSFAFLCAGYLDD